jgi:hypothetical protein
MDFHVGQKVQCIDDEVEPEPNPKCGAVYTVADQWVDKDGDAMIDLVELPNPDSEMFEAGYLASAFRALTEPQTDISAFTSLLTPKRAPERV